MCAICHATKQKKNPRTLCARCGSSDLPRMAIAYSWSDSSAKQGAKPRPRDGDRAYVRTRAGDELVRNAKVLKARANVRKTAAAVIEPLLRDPRVPTRKTWYSQVFLAGDRFKGELARDFCFTGILLEIVNDMIDRKMVQVRVPVELYVWFKRYAARSNSTMTDIFIDYLKQLKRKEERTVPVEQI